MLSIVVNNSSLNLVDISFMHQVTIESPSCAEISSIDCRKHYRCPHSEVLTQTINDLATRACTGFKLGPFKFTGSFFNLVKAGTGESRALWKFVLLVVVFFYSKGSIALCRPVNERSLLNSQHLSKKKDYRKPNRIDIIV